MKIKKFDVVELKNSYKAAIIDTINGNTYFAEIVDNKGNTIDKKEINELDINRIIFSK